MPAPATISPATISGPDPTKGTTAAAEVRPADQRQPHRHPEQPADPDRPEGSRPAPAERLDQLGVKRDEDRRERGPALEDAVAERTVPHGEQPLDGDERAGPVPGLAQA